MNNCLNVIGEVDIKLYDKDNNLKTERKVNNLVVAVGLDHIAKRLINAASPAEMAYMVLGTNSTAVNSGNILLGSELAGSRLEATRSSATAGKVTYARTFDPGVATGALVEAGIFNNDQYLGGTMLCRTVFSVIDKGALDTLSISWSITISAPA